MTRVALLVLVLIFPVTDLAAAWLYKLAGSSVSSSLRLFRDLLTISLAATCLLNSRLPSALHRSFLMFFGLIVVYSVLSVSRGLSVSLVFKSSATLLLPFMITFAAFEGVKSAKDFNRVFFILSGYAILTSIFSVWDSRNTDFWVYTVGMGDYLREVKGIVNGYNPATGLPWNFNGFEDKRRAAGLLAAPLANGFFIASVGMLVPFFYTGRLWPLGLLIGAMCVLGLYLSETRGAYLLALIALVVIMFYTARSPRQLLGIAIGSIVALSLLWEKLKEIVWYSVNLFDGSTIGHVDALVKNVMGLPGILLIGEGVGFAGSQASAQGEEIAGGGEGAIFSIAYQLGVPGALVFLYFYCTLLIYLYRLRFQDPLYIAALGIMLGAASSLIISEHVLTFSGMAACWILAGGLVSVQMRELPRNEGHTGFEDTPRI